jgi:hypothetical protein
VQGAHEGSVFAVLQRQVDGVPTADEYLETACHRASVDRSGRPVRGTARADPPLDLIRPHTALRRGRAMLPGPPAQPPSVQGRTTTAPQRLVPGSPGPWAAESEPRTGWPRSLPGAVAPAALGLPDGRFSRREQTHQSGRPGGSTWCGRSPRPTPATAHPGVRRTTPRPRTAVPASASRRGAKG